MTYIRTIGDATALAAVLPPLPHDTQSHAFFKSPEALADYVSGIAKTQCHSRCAWDKDRDFAGTDSMSQAIGLCRDGWQYGADSARKLRDKIAVSLPMSKRLARWDIAGAYPSVARALAGNPMNMRRLDMATSRRKPIVTLVHHMGGLASVPAQNFNHKAAAVAAVVDKIEESGYSVELIGVAVSDNGGKHDLCHQTAVMIKPAGSPVDMSRLAFGLGHVSMFRRFVFGLRCQDINGNKGLWSMGHTCEYDATKIPEGTYLIPSANALGSMVATEQATITKGVPFMLATLAKAGCPAFRDYQPSTVK